ncbi:MAG: hypothetical protein AAGD38_09085 [Acidobacteriota bacterium]
MFRLLCVITLCLSATPSWAVPQLIADLNQDIEVPGSVPERIFRVGDRVVFTTFPEPCCQGVSNGVWSTDGTVDGTFRLLDQLFPRIETVRGADLLFIDGVNTFTDGTPEGTFAVQIPEPTGFNKPAASGNQVFLTGIESLFRVDLDTRQVSSLSNFPDLSGLILPLPGGRVMLLNTPFPTIEILVSDGTASGTQTVFSASSGFVHQFTTTDDRVFFLFEDGDKEELWTVDSNDATRLAEFERNTVNLSLSSIGDLVVLVIGATLWRTDGTVAGTRAVVDLGVNPLSQFDWLGGDDDRGFFERSSSLFSTDGTAAGTIELEGSVVRYHGRAGDSYIFEGFDGLDRVPLVTDGTTPLLAIDPPGSTRFLDFDWADAVGDAFVIAVEEEGSLAGNLYRLDVPGGPLQPITNQPLVNGTTQIPIPGASLGDRLIFTGQSLDEGREPWITDGTAAGTRQLIDLEPGDPVIDPSDSPSSRPRHFTPVDNDVYFYANDGAYGYQLWRTDGDSVAERLTTRLRLGDHLGSQNAEAAIRVVGDLLFFLGGVDETWIYDTRTGNAEPIAPALDVSNAVTNGGRVLALQPADLNRPEVLWSSDGTVAGTFPLTSSTSDSGIIATGAPLVPLPDGRTLFVGTEDDTDSTTQIWTTRGQPGDLQALTSSSGEIGDVIGFRGGAAFSVIGDSGGILWWTDGSTLEQLAFLPGSVATNLEVAGETLFTASSVDIDDLFSVDLWATRDTTTLVLDAYRGNPDHFTAAGDLLVFERFTDDRDLWVSDGTAQGTRFLEPMAWNSSHPPTGVRADTGTFILIPFRALLFVDDDGEIVSLNVRVDGGGDHLLVDDVLLFSADHPELGNEPYRSDGTVPGTAVINDIATDGDSSPSSFTRFGNRILFAADDRMIGDEPYWMPTSNVTMTPAASDSLRLGPGGRFLVRATWQAPDGAQGEATAVPITSDTGAFYFFSDDNLELMVKVLDGRAINGHWWVFYASLSNVAFELSIEDGGQGSTDALYANVAGTFASLGDIVAIPDGSPIPTLNLTPPGERSGATPRASVGCNGDPNALCYQNDRFAVTVAWQAPDGTSGTGTPVPLAGESGAFWYFDDANLELLVKVLDGRAINGRWWVFYGSLSNVAFQIRVEDLETGAVKTYENLQGSFASRGDTGAF